MTSKTTQEVGCTEATMREELRWWRMQSRVLQFALLEEDILPLVQEGIKLSRGLQWMLRPDYREHFQAPHCRASEVLAQVEQEMKAYEWSNLREIEIVEEGELEAEAEEFVMLAVELLRHLKEWGYEEVRIEAQPLGEHWYKVTLRAKGGELKPMKRALNFLEHRTLTRAGLLAFYLKGLQGSWKFDVSVEEEEGETEVAMMYRVKGGSIFPQVDVMKGYR